MQRVITDLRRPIAPKFPRLTDSRDCLAGLVDELFGGMPALAVVTADVHGFIRANYDGLRRARDRQNRWHCLIDLNLSDSECPDTRAIYDDNKHAYSGLPGALESYTGYPRVFVHSDVALCSEHYLIRQVRALTDIIRLGQQKDPAMESVLACDPFAALARKPIAHRIRFTDEQKAMLLDYKEVLGKPKLLQIQQRQIELGVTHVQELLTGLDKKPKGECPNFAYLHCIGTDELRREFLTRLRVNGGGWDWDGSLTAGSRISSVFIHASANNNVLIAQADCESFLTESERTTLLRQVTARAQDLGKHGALVILSSSFAPPCAAAEQTLCFSAGDDSAAVQKAGQERVHGLLRLLEVTLTALGPKGWKINWVPNFGDQPDFLGKHSGLGDCVSLINHVLFHGRGASAEFLGAPRRSFYPSDYPAWAPKLPSGRSAALVEQFLAQANYEVNCTPLATGWQVNELDGPGFVNRPSLAEALIRAAQVAAQRKVRLPLAKARLVMPAVNATA